MDDQGRFGYNMLFGDFEWDNNGSASNLVQYASGGGYTPYPALIPGVLDIDLDRAGHLGAGILAVNRNAAPLWEGDNSVTEVGGTRAFKIPDQGLGGPFRVLSYSWVYPYNYHVFVTYPGFGILEFDTTPSYVRTIVQPNIGENPVIEDRVGAFGFGVYYSADETIYRMDCKQILGVGEPRVTHSALSSPWPNPGRDEIAMSYTLTESGSVQLEVLDVSGRRVALVEQGQRAAGRHALVWRRQTADGATIRPGLFFVRLTCSGGQSSQRLVLLDR